MQINHARITIAAFVASQGTDAINPPTLRTSDASSADVYLNPTGSETGNTANRATKQYVYEGTVASSGSLTLDFSGGGLLDPFGASVSFSFMKVIWVKVTGASLALTSTLGVIGSRTFIDGETVGVSSPSLGHAVINGVSDSLVFNNTAEVDATVQIVILGS